MATPFAKGTDVSKSVISSKNRRKQPRRLPFGMLCAGTALATSAHAQTIPAAPSAPVYQSVDANGVDLATGIYSLSVGQLALGAASSPSLVRLFTNKETAYPASFLSGLDNFHGQISIVNGYTVVDLGDRTETFSGNKTIGYTSVQSTGSTLTYNSGTLKYTFIDSAGSIYTYSGNVPLYNGEAPLILLQKPNGKTVTFNYKSYQWEIGLPFNPVIVSAYFLNSVNDSDGYQIKYNYTSNPAGPPILNSLISINNAVEYCDPSAVSCTPVNSWPTLTFGLNNSVLTVSDSLGRAWVYTLNASNQITAIKRPSSSVNDIVIGYDGNGHVSSVNRDGQTWLYNFSVVSGIATMTVTDPLSHVTTVVTNTAYGRPTSVKDALNHTTSYAYDGAGRLTQVTYPEGNYVQYTLDSRGNVTQATAVSKTPGTPANIITSAAYSTTCTDRVTCNEPNSTTDANGKTTSYTYDPTHGGVLTVTQLAVGGVAPQTRYTYTQYQAYYKNSGGSIVASGVPEYELTGISSCRTTASCAGTADETKATIGYGPQVAGTANNLLRISSTAAAGDGSLSATGGATYDAVGNFATRTDPLSHVTAYFFDADREPLGMIGPDPDAAGAMKMRATRITYNPDGLVTLGEQGTATANTLAAFNAMTTLQQVATAYDSADRKIQDSVQAGGTTYAVTQYSYDAASRLQCSAQRMNPSIFGSLPSSACTLGTTGSYGPDRIAYDTYDNANHLLKVTTGYGVTTANGFPATLQRDEETVTYSNNGKIKTLADAKNNLTTYVYDGFDRLSQTQYPSKTTPGSSNTADYEQLGYDPAGNITGRRLRGSALPAGSYDIGYGYDALERLNSKTLPSPEHAVSYAYDNFGQPKTLAGATTLSYVFDALGRMTSETQAYGSVAYQYDLANRRTRLTWQDSTYLTYDYDNVDEMTDIKESGSTILASFTYDDLGERKTKTLANGTSTTYGYDPVSRLTSLALAGGTNANTTTLSNYSPAGEIGAHVNSNDAFAWGAGITGSRAYTINGLNQFATIAGATQGYDSRGNLNSSGGSTYGYTSENYLSSASTGQTLVYDPIGRMHEYDAPTATRFVYDGGMITEEVNSSGAVLRRYAFGPAGDEPIVWYEGSGTTTRRYVDEDERGSVTRITDASGATVAVNSYDEYGIPGSTNQGRFGYTGQAWLSEVGLAYYKARVYSPTLGRFLQTDPVGYGNGANWYNYAKGNPIGFNDPDGTQSNDPQVTWVIDPCQLCNATSVWPQNGIITVTGRPWVALDNILAMNENNALGSALDVFNSIPQTPPTPPAPQNRPCPGVAGELASWTYYWGGKFQTGGEALALAGLISQAGDLTPAAPGTLTVGASAVVVGGSFSVAGAVGQGVAGLYYLAHGNPRPLASTIIGQIIDKTFDMLPNGEDHLGFRDSTAATADIVTDPVRDSVSGEDNHACRPE